MENFYVYKVYIINIGLNIKLKFVDNYKLERKF